MKTIVFGCNELTRNLCRRVRGFGFVMVVLLMGVFSQSSALAAGCEARTEEELFGKRSSMVFHGEPGEKVCPNCRTLPLSDFPVDPIVLDWSRVRDTAPIPVVNTVRSFSFVIWLGGESDLSSPSIFLDRSERPPIS